ncbi:hypothetical protein Nepgr_014779 [Nepenthes gracilis]|uniref:Uncharacterized protein n=1 Tax=Nepenthes gracilis TaxID=150966 RepID=A0AAD3SKM4_NEPGR|nr:hypothetical protein Nepgr_014779 [Nepenthes gracilis]
MASLEFGWLGAAKSEWPNYYGSLPCQNVCCASDFLGLLTLLIGLSIALLWFLASARFLLASCFCPVRNGLLSSWALWALCVPSLAVLRKLCLRFQSGADAFRLILYCWRLAGFGSTAGIDWVFLLGALLRGYVGSSIQIDEGGQSTIFDEVEVSRPTKPSLTVSSAKRMQEGLDPVDSRLQSFGGAIVPNSAMDRIATFGSLTCSAKGVGPEADGIAPCFHAASAISKAVAKLMEPIFPVSAVAALEVVSSEDSQDSKLRHLLLHDAHSCSQAGLAALEVDLKSPISNPSNSTKFLLEESDTIERPVGNEVLLAGEKRVIDCDSDVVSSQSSEGWSAEDIANDPMHYVLQSILMENATQLYVSSIVKASLLPFSKRAKHLDGIIHVIERRRQPRTGARERRKPECYMPAHQAKMHTSSSKIIRKSKRDRNNPLAYFFIIVFEVDSSEGRGLKSTRPRFPQEDRKKSHRLQVSNPSATGRPQKAESAFQHKQPTSGANETPITKTIRAIRLDRQLKDRWHQMHYGSSLQTARNTPRMMVQNQRHQTRRIECPSSRAVSRSELAKSFENRTSLPASKRDSTCARGSKRDLGEAMDNSSINQKEPRPIAEPKSAFITFGVDAHLPDSVKVRSGCPDENTDNPFVEIKFDYQWRHLKNTKPGDNRTKAPASKRKVCSVIEWNVLCVAGVLEHTAGLIYLMLLWSLEYVEASWGAPAGSMAGGLGSLFAEIAISWSCHCRLPEHRMTHRCGLQLVVVDEERSLALDFARMREFFLVGCGGWVVVVYVTLGGCYGVEYGFLFGCVSSASVEIGVLVDHLAWYAMEIFGEPFGFAGCGLDVLSVLQMMNPSAIMGSQAMDSMDSNRPEREFLSLQAARKVSFKVNSGDRDSRVSAGISISPATPVFQSDYCKEEVGSRHSVNHAMPCSSMGSSIPIEILTFESEQIDAKSAEGVLASSNICCEGLNFDAIGCHLDSIAFILVELLHGQDGYLGAKESGTEVLPGNRLCVSRQGSQMDDIDQHEVHSECAVALMASTVECNMMVSHLGMTQQSPQRSVVAVPNSAARSGLSMEHVDGPKGITWSLVVTKNSLGDDGEMP